MKAAYFRQHGGPEVMEYGDFPDPVAGPGEVIVDVHAASVNGADWKVRAGSYAQLTNLPYIPGRDFSGVVSALGAGVDDVAVGDPVFGVCETSREAAYAEKVAIKSAIVARKPGEPVAHPGCIGGARRTHCPLLDRGHAQAPERREDPDPGRCRRWAGFAIQLAKHIGARVITTTSSANIDYVRSLGADEVVDYRQQDFTKVVSGCDAVFDTVGGDVAKNSFSVLRPGGRAAFIASGHAAPTPPRGDVISLRPNAARDRAHLERIAALVTSGAVRVPEIKVYPLSQAAEAHRMSEGRHLRGKLVLQVR